MLDPDPVAPRGAVGEATPRQAGLLAEFKWREKKKLLMLILFLVVEDRK